MTSSITITSSVPPDEKGVNVVIVFPDDPLNLARTIGTIYSALSDVAFWEAGKTDNPEQFMELVAMYVNARPKTRNIMERDIL